MVIDLRTGDVAHWVRVEGMVRELYDVAILPGVAARWRWGSRPMRLSGSSRSARLYAEYPSAPVDAEKVRAGARQRIGELLAAATHRHPGTEGIADQRWYWAALALLDQRFAREVLARVLDQRQGWLNTQAAEDGDAADGFRKHLEHFVEVTEGRLTLGKKPDDLLDVLADLALASPAICALRALDVPGQASPGLGRARTGIAGPGDPLARATHTDG